MRSRTEEDDTDDDHEDDCNGDSHLWLESV